MGESEEKPSCQGGNEQTKELGMISYGVFVNECSYQGQNPHRIDFWLMIKLVSSAV